MRHPARALTSGQPACMNLDVSLSAHLLVAVSVLTYWSLVAGAAIGRSAVLHQGAATQDHQSVQESGQAKAPADSGIEGTILIKPVCPVERNPPLPECAPKPYQATVAVKTADGARDVRQFASDSDGRFTVALKPGKYLVVPENGNPYPHARSQTVGVEPHKFAEVSIEYDTGIR